MKLISLFIILSFAAKSNLFSQTKSTVLQYAVSFPQPAGHTYHVELRSSGWKQDTLDFKMPNWMPGYYQTMNYARTVENLLARDDQGKVIPINKINDNTWRITSIKNNSFIVNYDIKTSKEFVANSYFDGSRAYLVPANTFLYVDGHLQTPVSVKIEMPASWNKIATGLEMATSQGATFSAPDFDILYDCPFLIGNLEELPSFQVNGIEHRFMGYHLGKFDRVHFMEILKRVVEASVAVIGDIPYKQYTFIAIGPGRGGVEHLNNTTFSFDGNSLNTPDGMNRMINFLAHEYFHHYNVKRIRPLELGPFDYDHGSRTNGLWVSEGLSVYYEYLVVKRAGLINENTLFSDLEKNINALENSPGRFYQSLAQASYNTWKDGPFGTSGDDPGKSISYYDKGPVVGLFLDFEIRYLTQNKKSLDDVMRLLYRRYYKKENRGFTDAEFQQSCEAVAGASLARLFEYVYTTKELDYATYLSYAGLKLDTLAGTFSIHRIDKPIAQQTAILKSWMGE